MTPKPDPEDLLDAYASHLAARLSLISLRSEGTDHFHDDYRRRLLKEKQELEFRILETGSYLESLTTDP